MPSDDAGPFTIAVARQVLEDLRRRLSITRLPDEISDSGWDIKRRTVMPKGRHFAAMEEPERLAADIREFFRATR